jgi:hypothetical protein
MKILFLGFCIAYCWFTSAIGATVAPGYYTNKGAGPFVGSFNIALRSDKFCTLLGHEIIAGKVELHDFTHKNNIWYNMKNGDAVLNLAGRKGTHVLKVWIRRVGNDIQIFEIRHFPYRVQDSVLKKMFGGASPLFRKTAPL